MSRFKSRDTRAELLLRTELRSLHLSGYRVAPREIPGKPDVVFTRGRLAVFVDGEFWHGHPDVFRPGSRGPYWDAKIAGNVARDRAVDQSLTASGWLVLRFWSQEVIRDPPATASKVAEVLAQRRTETQPSL